MKATVQRFRLNAGEIFEAIMSEIEREDSRLKNFYSLS
jgi:hypothetical protein